jgi:hypothetical protein
LLKTQVKAISSIVEVIEVSLKVIIVYSKSEGKFLIEYMCAFEELLPYFQNSKKLLYPLLSWLC